MSTSRTVGAVLAWVVAVGAATAVAMVAIGAVGSGIVERGARPLSHAAVAERLTATTTTAETTAAPTTAVPTPSAEPAGPPPRVLTSPGGTVLARCAPGVEIVSTTPAQGYGVEGVEEEDGSLRVRFRSGWHGDGDGRVEVYVRCENGRPVATVETD